MSRTTKDFYIYYCTRIILQSNYLSDWCTLINSATLKIGLPGNTHVPPFSSSDSKNHNKLHVPQYIKHPHPMSVLSCLLSSCQLSTNRGNRSVGDWQADSELSSDEINLLSPTFSTFVFIRGLYLGTHTGRDDCWEHYEEEGDAYCRIIPSRWTPPPPPTRTPQLLQSELHFAH